MPKFHHRVIDPGTMYFDPRKDEVPPDLKECKKRAKLPEHVPHKKAEGGRIPPGYPPKFRW